MKLESVDFLRQIGTPEAFIPTLIAGGHITITGEVLLTYLRAAYMQGRKARDPYAWHSVEELFEVVAL